MGDQLGFLKGALVNYVVRNVKKLVPEYGLPGAVRFDDAIAKGQRGTFKPLDIQPDDIALLQIHRWHHRREPRAPCCCTAT